MSDGRTLLAEYAKSGSESVFRELVERYLNLVYSAAFRMVDGDHSVAEDIVQQVFSDLARKARTLPSGVALGGWLHRRTCHVAATLMRSERRRKFRERQAVEMSALQNESQSNDAIKPIIDEAINDLSATDRQAILLRFFEQLDFRAVGEAIGSGEDAARMRVNRALQKLEVCLRRRGIVCSTAALGLILTAEMAKAAPGGLAAAISAKAWTNPAITWWQVLLASKVQIALKAGIVAASIAAPLFAQHRATTKIRGQDALIERQSWQLAQLAEGNEQLSNRLAQARSAALPEGEFRELLRLRGEAGRLRQIAQSRRRPAPTRANSLQAMEQFWGDQLKNLKQWADRNPLEQIPELRLLSVNGGWLQPIGSPFDKALETDEDYRRAMSRVRETAEIQVLDTLKDAIHEFAKATHAEFPTELSQLKPYLRELLDPDILDRFIIVPRSTLVRRLRGGNNEYVITQKAPADAELDTRFACGADGWNFAGESVSNRWTFVP